jgi:hypothetical protein
MRTLFFNLIIAAVGLGFTAHAMGQYQSGTGPVTCEKLYPGQPGDGVAYIGTVTNHDYRFSATIPSGRTAWGSGLHAPFHGFVMFFNNEMPKSSCISFYIRIRVDIPENPRDAPAVEGRHIAVGNRRGIETSRTGVINGINYENRVVSLELPRDGYVNDLSIILVTPASDKRRTVPVFDKFVSGLKFW